MPTMEILEENDVDEKCTEKGPESGAEILKKQEILEKDAIFRPPGYQKRRKTT